jgi:hypothetical protein
MTHLKKTVLYPRRPEFSATLLGEPEMFLFEITL